MILGTCTVDGCKLFTIGSRCVEHDLPVTRTFVRGRPFHRNRATLVAARTEPTRVVSSNTFHGPTPLARA
jgi:hypothetical protein